MDISTLLKAADFIERKEREAEHGYALSVPASVDLENKQLKRQSSKTKGARSTHNELEKNRRANLRNCFEKLREVVLSSNDSGHHTTLGLLKKARQMIKEIEGCHRQNMQHLRKLVKERQFLIHRQKRFIMDGDNNFNSHSISECSNSSSSSSFSSNYPSTEPDDIIVARNIASSEQDEKEDVTCDYELLFSLNL